MKTKILILLMFGCFFVVNTKVYAESKDVQAIYKQSYNVTLDSKIINNNTVMLQLDEFKVELSSSQANIKAVLIKVEDTADDYVKNFTSSSQNYYLALYNENEKITQSDITIQLKVNDKVLNVYNNNGKLLEKSTGKIKLTGNDYFFTLTDFIDTENSKYVITEVDTLLENIEEIETNPESKVEIYNSKDQKIESTEKLGTNYKVVVDDNGERTVHTIVVMGDTTGDADINLNDVTRLYHHYKGIESMDESYILAGDVAKKDETVEINLNDVTKIYHYYKKLIPSLTE